MRGVAIVTNEPVDLDKHRGMAARKSTEIRRRLQEVQADWEATRKQQDEFERFLLVAPAMTWSEAAAKARYLLQLFASTVDGQDPRRQTLILRTLEDLDRLSGCTKEVP